MTADEEWRLREQDRSKFIRNKPVSYDRASAKSDLEYHSIAGTRHNSQPEYLDTRRFFAVSACPSGFQGVMGGRQHMQVDGEQDSFQALPPCCAFENEVQFRQLVPCVRSHIGFGQSARSPGPPQEDWSVRSNSHLTDSPNFFPDPDYQILPSRIRHNTLMVCDSCQQIRVTDRHDVACLNVGAWTKSTQLPHPLTPSASSNPLTQNQDIPNFMHSAQPLAQVCPNILPDSEPPLRQNIFREPNIETSSSRYRANARTPVFRSVHEDGFQGLQYDSMNGPLMPIHEFSAREAQPGHNIRMAGSEIQYSNVANAENTSDLEDVRSEPSVDSSGWIMLTAESFRNPRWKQARIRKPEEERNRQQITSMGGVCNRCKNSKRRVSIFIITLNLYFHLTQTVPPKAYRTTTRNTESGRIQYINVLIRND